MEDNQNQNESNINASGANTDQQPGSSASSGPRVFGSASSSSGSGPRVFGSGSSSSGSGPRVFGSSGSSSYEGNKEKYKAGNTITVGNVEDDDDRTIIEKLDSIMGFVTRPFDLLFEYLEKCKYDKHVEIGISILEKAASIVVILAGVGYVVSTIYHLIRYGISNLFGGIPGLGGYYFFSPSSTIPLVLISTIIIAIIAPKALKLARSVLDTKTYIPVRPEYLFLLKMGIIFWLLFETFCIPYFIGVLLLPITAPIALIFIGLLCKPNLIGIKADRPGNAVVELITIILLPLRITMFFLSPVVVVVSMLLFVAAIFTTELFYLSAIFIPVLVPLAAYFLYLLIAGVFEKLLAICIVPSKLDEINETLQEQKPQSEGTENQQA